MTNQSQYRKWGILAFLFVSILCVIAFFFLNTHRGDNQWNNYGEAAGIYTALGTFFTGLSFAAFIITLIMQSAELKLQRDELELQRIEMKNNTQALLDQKKEFEQTNTYYETKTIYDNFEQTLKRIYRLLDALSVEQSYTSEAETSGRARFNSYRKVSGRYLLEEYKYDLLSNPENPHVTIFGIEPLRSVVDFALRDICKLLLNTESEIHKTCFKKISLAMLSSLSPLEWIYIIKYHKTPIVKSILHHYCILSENSYFSFYENEDTIELLNSVVYEYLIEKITYHVNQDIESIIDISTSLKKISKNKYSFLYQIIEEEDKELLKEFILKHGFSVYCEIELQLQKLSSTKHSQP